jgi:hypothetical protein
MEIIMVSSSELQIIDHGGDHGKRGRNVEWI